MLGLGFSAIQHGKTDLTNLSPRAQAEALIDALIETGTDPDMGLPIGSLVDPAAFLRRIIRGCTADLNGDGEVGGDDLAALLSDWGTNSSSSDLDGDGTVGPEDLAMLLGSWSFCNRSVCGDGICGPGESDLCKADCSGPETAATCPVGMVEDCTGLVCVPDSYIGDGFCDSWMLTVRPPWTPNICCYDSDGGDCSKEECLLPCPDGEILDCAGHCVPSSLVANGYCDEPSNSDGLYDLNCAGTGYDGGDCQTPGQSWCGDGVCDTNESPWCPDCDEPGKCPTGYLIDCSGSGECHSDTWLGDGYCDGFAQQWGADLCCYELDGGDCTEGDCSPPAVCGDGVCEQDESPASCPEDCKSCPDGYLLEDDGTCTYSCALNLTGDATCGDDGLALYEFFFPGCQLVSVSFINDAGETVQYDVSFTDYMWWNDWPDGCRTFSFVFVNGEEASIEICSKCSTAVCGDGVCEQDESPANCPEDCTSCPEGTIADCDGSGECWDETWIGDGYCDGLGQAYGADLCCYKLDGGDCTPEDC